MKQKPYEQPLDLARDFEEFERRLAAEPVALTGAMFDALRSYGQTLADRSAQMNLVSPGDRGRIFTRHVFESLVPGLIDRARTAARFVDIGSGAGLPGIPVALACPDLEAVLIEPRLRRAQFLEATVAGLGLSPRVAVFHGSVERYGAVETEAHADLVTARAVASLPRVWAWSLGLLVPGGWLAVFKGPSEAAGDLDRLPAPLPAAREVHQMHGAPRALLLLQKPFVS